MDGQQARGEDMRATWRGVLIAAGVAVLAVTGCVPQQWRIVETPAPAPVKGGTAPDPPLTMIECGGPSSCVAIGRPEQTTTALAYDGTGWRAILPPPNPSPQTLDCASPAWCVVFGSNLAAIWDGTSWTTEPASHPADPPPGWYAEYDVSCPVERVCYATRGGGTGDAHLWRWDGTGRWAPVAGSESFEISDGLVCPAVDECLLTTRRYADPSASTVVRWDGTTFAPLTMTGPPAFLHGIECPEPGRCVVVGTDRSSNGALVAGTIAADEVTTTRTNVAAPWRASRPDDLDCASLTLCLTIEISGSVAVYDGVSWRAAPSLGGYGEVACATETRCFALQYEGLARWDGTAWAEVEWADPVPRAGFTDVSCLRQAPRRWCLAVGTYTDGDATKVLASSWEDGTWRLLPDIPLPAGRSAKVGRVSCTAPDFCAAVVSATGSSESAGSLLAVWDGASWHVTASLLPSLIRQDRLEDTNDVWCDGPRSCLAISMGPAPVAARWDGMSWAMVPGPAGDGFDANTLAWRARLTCTTPTFCLRLASATDPVPFGGPLNTLQRWDGTSWTSFPDPFTARPPASYDLQRGLDVDCPAPDTCVLVASTPSPWGSGDPVVARWTGTSWAWEALPRPAGQSTGELHAGAASCDGPTRCVLAAGTTAESAMAWGGPPWAALRSPPHSGWTVRTASVSCLPAGGLCLVVGSREREQTRLPVAYVVQSPPRT
jgi:hypothetical protein